jgi:hypothetical protein
MQIDMQGKMWLRRNVSPSEGMTLSVYPYPTAHMVKSSLNAALPGYVDFSGIKRIESAVFAGMPGIPRDQTELTLMDKNGQTWAQNSEMLYSPAEAASILNSGENTVKIGSEGYNEWFTTAKDAILSFSLPAKDRVIVFAADGSSLYDSAVDSGEVFVKQGSYIELAGQIGDACKVTAR